MIHGPLSLVKKTVELRERHPLRRQPVDVRRADDRVAGVPEVAVPAVVQE
jgi:hypothetical protein